MSFCEACELVYRNINSGRQVSLKTEFGVKVRGLCGDRNFMPDGRTLFRGVEGNCCRQLNERSGVIFLPSTVKVEPAANPESQFLDRRDAQVYGLTDGGD